MHHKEHGKNMRMIYGVLFTIGVLSGAMVIRAQGEQAALQGLPAYGVTLSGRLENPVIENQSGRVVIGYDVKFSDANGRGMVENRVTADSMLPAGIPDGGSVYVKGAFPINPTRRYHSFGVVPMGTRAEVLSAGQGPIVIATLRSVVFGDGQFVGVDEQGAFEQFGKKLKAVTGVGMMAKMQAWDYVEALAQAFAQRPPAPPPSGEDLISYTSRQVAAMRLAQTRRKGDAAASKLAEIYSSLPTVWK